MSNVEENGLYVIGVILTVFLVIIIVDCCTDNTTKITKGRRRSRRGSREPQSVTVTQVTNEGLTNTRIPLTSGRDVVDEDGFVLPPEPGDEASPVVVPPYPVDARHPTPQTVPVPGFATHNAPYPMQTPHPVPVGGNAPYPPAGAGPYPPVSGAAPYPPVSGAAPYPPAGPPTGSTAPYPDYSANPPSYSEAVGQPPIHPPPSKEGYSKQSPYNPNY